ncbi:hypothetical protein DDE82_007765 [Stemphylium lycopersici]|nr:hypothetical protein DDE82_007765 [Stemphylium lycopersici]
MCHKLFQVYACGHQKPVCTTPCPHAIATGRQLPRDNNNSNDNSSRQEARLSRSVSVVFSTTPPVPTSTASRSNMDDPSSQRQSQAHPSPLLVVTNSTQEQRQSGIPPAFHFVASGPEPRSPLAQSSSQNPCPTWLTTGTLVNASSTPLAPADPEVNDE